MRVTLVTVCIGADLWGKVPNFLIGCSGQGELYFCRAKDISTDSHQCKCSEYLSCKFDGHFKSPVHTVSRLYDVLVSLTWCSEIKDKICSRISKVGSPWQNDVSSLFLSGGGTWGVLPLNLPVNLLSLEPRPGKRHYIICYYCLWCSPFCCCWKTVTLQPNTYSKKLSA